MLFYAKLMLDFSIQYFIMDKTAEFYSRPSYEFRGGNFPVFAGARRQRGGSIFGSLKRLFMPIAKKVGKSLFSHGIGLAQDVMQDTSSGSSFKDSIKRRGKSRAINFGKDAARHGLNTLSDMIGKGGRRVSRKRKRRAKSSKRRPKKKRRTTTNF